MGLAGSRGYAIKRRSARSSKVGFHLGFLSDFFFGFLLNFLLGFLKSRVYAKLLMGVISERYQTFKGYSRGVGPTRPPYVSS
jgi:hypothetical protein